MMDKVRDSQKSPDVVVEDILLDADLFQSVGWKSTLTNYFVDDRMFYQANVKNRYK